MTGRPIPAVAGFGRAAYQPAGHTCDWHRHPDDDDTAGHDAEAHRRHGAGMGHDHGTETGHTHDPSGCAGCRARYEDPR